jgi:lysophospholipase L1-like esterase
MQKAGIDVVLMDNQRSPRIQAAPEHLAIDQATAEVAAETGAGLFSRGALMDGWQREGVPYDRFVSPDGLHHNDIGYRCLAEAVAHSIARGLGPDTVSAAKPGAGVPFGSATR